MTKKQFDELKKQIEKTNAMIDKATETTKTSLEKRKEKVQAKMIKNIPLIYQTFCECGFPDGFAYESKIEVNEKFYLEYCRYDITENGYSSGNVIGKAVRVWFYYYNKAESRWNQVFTVTYNPELDINSEYCNSQNNNYSIKGYVHKQTILDDFLISVEYIADSFNEIVSAIREAAIVYMQKKTNEKTEKLMTMQAQ